MRTIYVGLQVCPYILRPILGHLVLHRDDGDDAQAVDDEAEALARDVGAGKGNTWAVIYWPRRPMRGGRVKSDLTYPPFSHKCENYFS